MSSLSPYCNNLVSIWLAKARKGQNDAMTRAWILLLLLSGCPKDVEVPANRAETKDQLIAAGAALGAPTLRTLVGLYQGDGAPAHQMCVVERGGDYSFGLVVWGGNNHSCSGSGKISRDGESVRLAMEGDSPCTLTGAIAGKTIRLSEHQPAGCAYYCGARARLGGAVLAQRGSTLADALKARDLVGEPLCSTL
jgi:hypothetical protein